MTINYIAYAFMLLGVFSFVHLGLKITGEMDRKSK